MVSVLSIGYLYWSYIFHNPDLKWNIVQQCTNLQLTIVPCFVGALHTGWLFRNQYKTMAFHDDDNDWVSRWMPLLFVCWHRTQEASRFSSLLHSSLLHTFLLHSTRVHSAHSPIAKHTAKEWYILQCTPIVHCGGVVHMWLSERSLGCLWQLCHAAFLKETKIRHFLPDETNKAPCEEKLVATLKDVASTGQDESSLFPTMWAILCSDP